MNILDILYDRDQDKYRYKADYDRALRRVEILVSNGENERQFIIPKKLVDALILEMVSVREWASNAS